MLPSERTLLLCSPSLAFLRSARVIPHQITTHAAPSGKRGRKEAFGRWRESAGASPSFFLLARRMAKKKRNSHLDERTALSSGPDGDDDSPLLPRPTISGDVGASTAGLPEEEATALALAPRARASEDEEEEAADEPAAAATTTGEAGSLTRAARPRGGAIAPAPGTHLKKRMLPLAEEEEDTF